MIVIGGHDTPLRGRGPTRHGLQRGSGHRPGRGKEGQRDGGSWGRAAQRTWGDRDGRLVRGIDMAGLPRSARPENQIIFYSRSLRRLDSELPV